MQTYRFPSGFWPPTFSTYINYAILFTPFHLLILFLDSITLGALYGSLVPRMQPASVQHTCMNAFKRNVD